MKEKLLKVLSFFNLLDKDKNISITNITVLIMTVKLCFLSTFTLPEVGAFLVAMLSYSHKRIETTKAMQILSNMSGSKGDVSE